MPKRTCFSCGGVFEIVSPGQDKCTQCMISPKQDRPHKCQRSGCIESFTPSSPNQRFCPKHSLESKQDHKQRPEHNSKVFGKVRTAILEVYSAGIRSIDFECNGVKINCKLTEVQDG